MFPRLKSLGSVCLSVFTQHIFLTTRFLIYCIFLSWLMTLVPLNSSPSFIFEWNNFIIISHPFWLDFQITMWLFELLDICLFLGVVWNIDRNYFSRFDVYCLYRLIWRQDFESSFIASCSMWKKLEELHVLHPCTLIWVRNQQLYFHQNLKRWLCSAVRWAFIRNEHEAINSHDDWLRAELVA